MNEWRKAILPRKPVKEPFPGGSRSYYYQIQNTGLSVLVIFASTALQSGFGERLWQAMPDLAAFGVASAAVKAVPYALAYLRVRFVNDKRRLWAEWGLILAVSLLLACLLEALFFRSLEQRNGNFLLTLVAALVWLCLFLHQPPHIGRIGTALLLTGRFALLFYVPMLLMEFTELSRGPALWVSSFNLSLFWVFFLLFGFFLLCIFLEEEEKTNSSADHLGVTGGQ